MFFMETIEITRKELYDKVWSTPFSKLTTQYAISVDGLKKVCKQFDIPIPIGGYWMKLKHNKPVKKTKFNDIFGGVGKIVLTIREEGSTVNLDQTTLTIRTKEIESDPKAPLIVPDKLTKPDILTIQTQEFWKAAKNDRFYREDKKIIYPIRFDINNRERALRFMDTFTKLIRYRGHTITKEYSETGVLIGNIFIEIDLREASKRIQPTDKHESSKLIPTGEFIFKIGRYSGEKEWRDGTVKIETLLAKIVAKLEILAQKEKEQEEEYQTTKLIREEKEKVQAEIKKRRDDEVTKFNKLVALSEQYEKTRLIRQYIEARKQNAIETNTLNLEKKEWINWANDKADWLDPLINKPDEILDDK
jgi:hypothetical protein